MKDVESLLELGLRDIDGEFFNKNLYNIRAYTERLNDTKYKDIFLGIRHKRFTFYYMGREILSLDFSNDITIYTRSTFSSNEELNKKFDDIMSHIPLVKDYGKTNEVLDIHNSKKNNKYVIYKDDIKGYSIKNVCEYLLENLKDLIYEYYKGKYEKELPVQGLYTINYNDIKKNLYIVDMEFVLPGEVNKRLDNTVNGRYDMIALNKIGDKYKLVFIELKVKKDACKGDSGINSHIKDMDEFLKEYNKKELLGISIENNVKRILEIKQQLKLIDKINIDDIDFNNPEFWIMMDMKDNTTINNLDDIRKIVSKDGELLTEMQFANLRFYKGDVVNKIIDELK